MDKIFNIITYIFVKKRTHIFIVWLGVFIWILFLFANRILNPDLDYNNLDKYYRLQKESVIKAQKYSNQEKGREDILGALPMMRVAGEYSLKISTILEQREREKKAIFYFVLFTFAIIMGSLMN